jgi:hypothetical protein
VLDSFEVETSLSSSDDEVEECEASGSSLWNVQREILKRKPAQQNVKQVKIKNRIISPFQLCFFAICVGHSSFLRLITRKLR